MLPALALIPQFTLQSASIAVSVGGFFTYLWQQNYKKGEQNYDYTFGGNFSKIPQSYTVLESDLSKYQTIHTKAVKDSVIEYSKIIPQPQTISTNINQDITTKTTLIDVLKTSNFEIVEQQKILNNQLTILNNTLLKMFEAKNTEITNQNILNTVVSENLKSLNISMASLATLPKITAEFSDYNLLVQSTILGELQNQTTEIKNLVTATTNQELKAVTNTNISTNSIAEAIKDIGKTQNAVNEKTLEKLNLELSKDITYEGKAINKAELDKIKNLEILNNVKAENSTELNKDLDMLDDLLNGGFDININPFEVILRELKNEFIADSSEIKTKYNLK